jgi:hypothetical protein
MFEIKTKHATNDIQSDFLAFCDTRIVLISYTTPEGIR